MESKKNIEILLKEKIQELGEFLISICDNDDKKIEIKEALINLPLYKILLFITFLDINKIDTQITEFVKIFCLNNTDDNREKIKEYLNYFLQI